MRHRMAGNKLGRNSSWRKATIRDIAKATLDAERILTTKAKAKEARKMVDRLITLGKKDTLAAKRRAFAILCDHKLVSNLFKNIAVRFRERSGGYTRIVHFGTRRGDNAQMVFLELTQRSVIETKKLQKKKTKAKTAVPEASAATESHGEPKKKGPKESQKGEQSSTQPQEIPKHKKKDRGSKKEKSSKKITGGFKKFFKKEPPKS